jgi:hypothetical protein
MDDRLSLPTDMRKAECRPPTDRTVAGVEVSREADPRFGDRVDHSAAALATGYLQQAQSTLVLGESQIGMPPAEFDFVGADAARGHWAVVRDPAASQSLAIEQSSRDLPDEVLPLAVYRPLALKNLDARVRFKVVSGRMRNAGLAIRR